MVMYKFSKGDKVTELLSVQDVFELRRNFDGDCFNLATYLYHSLNSAGILASFITFKNGNPFLDGGIHVWSDLTKRNEVYTHHSVVLLGDCVMDLLHTDRLIKTTEYVKKLKADNPKLRVDQTTSGIWYTAAGHERPIEMKSLLSGNWG